MTVYAVFDSFGHIVALYSTREIAQRHSRSSDLNSIRSMYVLES